MKIYQALYNPMTEESGYITLSIHASKEGAEQRIKEHKESAFKEYEEHVKEQQKKSPNIPPTPFAQFEDWSIIETELLP